MRVLVVEDDAALQQFIRKGLELDGHAAVAVGDGQAALKELELTQYDLVFLDLGLPKLDGVEVLRALRTRNDETPVLILTGRDGLDERLSSFAAGADDFLKKPFSFQELLARGRALHRRSTRRQSGVVSCGDLRMDRIARSVTFGGADVSLTGKEFALLEHLLVQQGRCSSRRELISEVWKMTSDTNTNVIDVYINYLRRKLQNAHPHSADPIQTIRGEGYRLAAVRQTAFIASSDSGEHIYEALHNGGSGSSPVPPGF